MIIFTYITVLVNPFPWFFLAFSSNIKLSKLSVPIIEQKYATIFFGSDLILSFYLICLNKTKIRINISLAFIIIIFITIEY